MYVCRGRYRKSTAACPSCQEARTLAFCASNSASVRMPWFLSSARSFSCGSCRAQGAGRPAGAAGGVLRLRVLLLLLGVLLVLLRGPAVGLPAGDAVRHRGRRAGDHGRAGDASHQSGHGARPFCAGSAGGSFSGIERRLEGVEGDIAGRDQLGAAAAEGLGERRRPSGSRTAGSPPTIRARSPRPRPRGRCRRSGPRSHLRRWPGRARRRRRGRPARRRSVTPSSLRMTNRRSRIRMIPWSTRSTRIGKPSPVILLPGNSTIR